MENISKNTATVNNNSTVKAKEYLSTHLLKQLSKEEIESILKMKYEEVINLKEDGTVFFKYRLALDENGVKKGYCYDTFELKISNDLLYHFCIYGLKQKLKDILATDKKVKTKDKDGNEKITYFNYSESELKAKAKEKLENFAVAFESGSWTIRTEKLNVKIENVKNKVIYYNILNLRFNNFDINTALLLNKQNEALVKEVYALNENDFNLKCKEYNVE